MPRPQLKPLLIALGLFTGLLPAAVASTPPLPAAASPGHPGVVDRYLQDKAAREPNAKLPVLITRRTRTAARDAVQAHGGHITRELKLGNTLAAEVPASRLAHLAAEPGVVRIAYDAPVKVQTKNASSSKLDPNTLLTAYPFATTSTSVWRSGVRGTGVTVAVLDSGLVGHDDFLGTSMLKGIETPSHQTRTLARVPVATDSSGGPSDDNGHGTFVAGIIAGRGWGDLSTTADDGRYVGTAPDVNLVSVKVSNKYGEAKTSDVIAGIQWTVDNKVTYNIRVLNLSLLSLTGESYKTSLLDAAVELAWFKGLIVVAASGNGGPNTVTSAPANDPYVITVGATDDQGTRSTTDDRLAWFSAYGTTPDGFTKPDLVAPGRRIVSTLSSPTAPLALLFPERVTSDGRYIRLSGTSASAAVVSGVTAQLLQLAPTLTPNQLKWLLERTADRVPGVGTGAGYPDTYATYVYLYTNGFPSPYWSTTLNTAAFGLANQGLVPNNYLAAAYASLTGAVSWDTVSWDTVSWDAVSWDAVSWDSVSWDTVSWDTTADD